MKKQLLFIIFLTAFIGSYAQQRHRTASGEPYDIFLSVKPTGGLAQGDFEKNYTYVYGVNMAFELSVRSSPDIQAAFHSKQKELGCASDAFYTYRQLLLFQ